MSQFSSVICWSPRYTESDGMQASRGTERTSLHAPSPMSDHPTTFRPARTPRSTNVQIAAYRMIGVSASSRSNSRRLPAGRARSCKHGTVRSFR